MIYLTDSDSTDNDHVVYITTGYMGIKSLVYNPNDIDKHTKELLDEYVHAGSYDIPNSNFRITIITNDNPEEIVKDASIEFFDTMDDKFIKRCKDLHNKAMSNKHAFYCKSVTFKNVNSSSVNFMLGHDYTEIYVYLINNILYLTQVAILGCKHINYDSLTDMMNIPVTFIKKLAEYPGLRDVIAEYSEKIGSLQQLLPLHDEIFDLYDRSKNLQPKDKITVNYCCDIVKELATLLVFSNYYVIATDYLQYYASNSPNFNDKDLEKIQELFDIDSKISVLKLEKNIKSFNDDGMIDIGAIERFYDKLIPHSTVNSFIKDLKESNQITNQTKNEDEDE